MGVVEQNKWHFWNPEMKLHQMTGIEFKILNFEHFEFLTPFFRFFTILRGSNLKMLATIVFYAEKYPLNMCHTVFRCYFEI